MAKAQKKENREEVAVFYSFVLQNKATIEKGLKMALTTKHTLKPRQREHPVKEVENIPGF